jgi:hypothetical protein
MSRNTCPECGKPFDLDHIPPRIRALGVLVGAPDPVWYVGRVRCPNAQPDSPTKAQQRASEDHHAALPSRP